MGREKTMTSSTEASRPKPKSFNWIVARYLFVVALVVLTVLFLICAEWNNALTKLFESLKLDVGSISALFATFAVIFLFGIDKEIRSTCGITIVRKGSNRNTFESSLGIVTLILAIAALIAMWLVIRTIGLTIQKYIVEATPIGNGYFASDIFYVLSFILTANLCFTLYRTLASSKDGDGEKGILNWIVVPIQALIIGLVVILPRYNDKVLTDVIGGINGYVTVVAVFIGSLTLLCFVWDRLRDRKQKPSE
jgi:hypothetical protein